MLGGVGTQASQAALRSRLATAGVAAAARPRTLADGGAAPYLAATLGGGR